MKLIPALVSLSLVPLLGAELAAQLPSPNPIPRVAPRANWVRPTVTGAPAQRRDNPGAASSDRLYVFGGRQGTSGSTVYNELFEFDPVALAWTSKTAEGAVGSPPARGGASVAWDQNRNKLVVFGGDDGAGTLLGDTWEWDRATNTWANVTPPGASPSPRRYAAMAFEPVSGGMLLFGGDTTIPMTAPSSETWLFIGGSWVLVPTATTPPPRRFHSMCTRTDFNDVFLCGGTNDAVSPVVRHLDAWRWTGSNWSQFAATTFPASSSANQAVYDPLRRRVVLQGGQGISVPNSANGGQYGDEYGGSPTGWTSEFDCVVNEWIIYGDAASGSTPGFNVADPVIGRASRYFAGFVASAGTIVKYGGQDPSGRNAVYTYTYQADVIASFNPGTPGCAGTAGVPTLVSTRPWTSRNMVLQVTNAPAGAACFLSVGLNPTSVPLSLFGIGAASCVFTLDPIATAPMSGATPTLSLAVPNAPALSGATLLNQALVLDFSAGRTLVTNRGDAVFGAL